MPSGNGQTSMLPAATAEAERFHVCFVGLKCYDLLAGIDPPRYIGGIESQLTLLARGLAERGHRVSFITYDHGQPDGIQHDGVTVYKAFKPDAGLRFVRFIYPRWAGLWSAMSRANADIYLQMGAGCETGQVALWCHMHKRRVLFAAASDTDCLRALPRLSSYREKALFRFGIGSADMVITQTGHQQSHVEAEFGLHSTVIPACCEPVYNKEADLPFDRRVARPRLLWVGRISEVKRPHLLFELSDLLPDCVIDVVGEANTESAYARDFRELASTCRSVELHGKVPRHVLARLYHSSLALLSTSSIEGFPLTFLEAWSRGLPIVSTVDPDGAINNHGTGATVDDMQGMARQIRVFLTARGRWEACSQAACSYFQATHTVAAAVVQYAECFRRLIAERRGQSRATGRRARRCRRAPSLCESKGL